VPLVAAGVFRFASGVGRFSQRDDQLSSTFRLVNLYLKIFFSFFKLRSNREVRLAIGTHNLMENRISSTLFVIFRENFFYPQGQLSET